MDLPIRFVSGVNYNNGHIRETYGLRDNFDLNYTIKYESFSNGSDSIYISKGLDKKKMFNVSRKENGRLNFQVNKSIKD